MRQLALIFFMVLLQAVAVAQKFPSEIWHEGKLVLASEDTLVGQVKYNLVQNLVQVKVGEKLYTYSAKSIFYFEIFDETSESYREFYVLPYGLVSNYKAPVIFEVLVEGRVTLLSREAIVTRNIQDPFSYGTYTRDVLVYDYYFLDRNGKITEYTMKKRDLLEALSNRYNQVAEYMKVNRLRADDRNDLVRIIAFYNALF